MSTFGIAIHDKLTQLDRAGTAYVVSLDSGVDLEVLRHTSTYIVAKTPRIPQVTEFLFNLDRITSFGIKEL